MGEPKRKITVSVDPEVLAQAQAAVDAGRASSVSAYVTEAVRDRAARERDIRAMTDRWGPLPPEATAWARQVLGITDGEQGSVRQAS